MERVWARNPTQAFILETLRRRSPVTRSEIARHTGFTPATVGHVVTKLLEAGVVEEVGRRPQGRGQPPIELRIRPHAAFTVGIHLEHREVSAVLVDAAGTVLARVAEQHDKSDPQRSVSRMQQLIAHLTDQAGLDLESVLGIGLAAFGPIDVAAGTVSPPIYPDSWQQLPLRSMVADRIGVPVFLENNATAAAMGEYWYGVGKPFEDFFHIFLGYGLGGGLFLKGSVHRGVSNNAAEVGHVITEQGGKPWFLGPPGSLEAVASLLAMERDLGAAAVLEAEARLQERDAELSSWLELAARHLAQVAVSIDHLLDLEAIILGGLLPSSVLRHLKNRVQQGFDFLSIRNRPHRAELLVGQTGSYAPALGAAMLPLYHAFLPERSPAMPNAPGSPSYP